MYPTRRAKCFQSLLTVVLIIFLEGYSDIIYMNNSDLLYFYSWVLYGYMHWILSTRTFCIKILLCTSNCLSTSCICTVERSRRLMEHAVIVCIWKEHVNATQIFRILYFTRLCVYTITYSTYVCVLYHIIHLIYIL